VYEGNEAALAAQSSIEQQFALGSTMDVRGLPTAASIAQVQPFAPYVLPTSTHLMTTNPFAFSSIQQLRPSNSATAPIADLAAQATIQQHLALASAMAPGMSLPTTTRNNQAQPFMPFVLPVSASLASPNPFALSSAQHLRPGSSTMPPIAYSALGNSSQQIYPPALAQLLASSRLDTGVQAAAYPYFQQPEMQPGMPALTQPSNLLLVVNNNNAVSTPSGIASIATAPASLPSKSRCETLYLEQDDDNLSPYQCLARKQIEVFGATERDLQDNAQGRNRKICVEQVGIRCRHCGTQHAKERAKGAVFFPSRLVGVYQTGQNLTNTHLVTDCTSIPRDIREDLIRVRLKEKGAKTRKSAYGGGQHYWAACLRVQGVVETTDQRLRFTSPGER
jgi:hypothetical protein